MLVKCLQARQTACILTDMSNGDLFTEARVEVDCFSYTFIYFPLTDHIWVQLPSPLVASDLNSVSYTHLDVYKRQPFIHLT